MGALEWADRATRRTDSGRLDRVRPAHVTNDGGIVWPLSSSSACEGGFTGILSAKWRVVRGVRPSSMEISSVVHLYINKRLHTVSDIKRLECYKYEKARDTIAIRLVQQR